MPHANTPYAKNKYFALKILNIINTPTWLRDFKTRFLDLSQGFVAKKYKFPNKRHKYQPLFTINTIFS